MTVSEPPSRVSRQEMIAERKRRSALWRIIHAAGSLTCALIVLAAIGLVIGTATFMESSSGTKIAHTYIYRSWWFFLLLGILCVNLAAVTLTRWPWQKKHIGFVVTHYGIITLLAGAVVGLNFGFEGNVTLEKDEPPTNRITIGRSILQIQSPADPNAAYRADFDAELAKPSEKNPRVFPVPMAELKIVVDGFSPNIQRVPKFLPATSSGAGAAVLLTLVNKAGKSFNIPLSLTRGMPAEDHFFGLADITLRASLPGETATGEQENQIIFAKYSPVVQASGHPSGIVAELSENGDTVTIQGEAHARRDLMDEPLTVAGAQVIVEKYWPDFAMKDGQPATVSEQPNNPAALVRITKLPDPKKPSLDLALTGSSVAYQLRRGGVIYESGTAQTGTDLTLQWADWHAKFTQVLPSAVLTTELEPGPELPKGQPGVPGFRARLAGPNNQGPAQWVSSGEVASLTEGKNIVRLAYGLASITVPFTIRLVQFDVPRDAGTDRPSNFLATVEFRDIRTGETKTGVAQMNHPASFPGTFWASLTGFNYKFSQAEWNPRNLNQTTLQVLYDPGWLLKWLGSLGICVGIAIMFYWKPGGG